MTNEKMQISKRNDENDEQYIFRVCSLKDQLGYTWEKIGDLLNQELGNEFNESAYRKKFQSFQKMLKSNENILFDNDGYLKEIQAEKRGLEKERMKLQAEKLEYNRWLRENARDELIAEKIVNAVRELKPITPPSPIQRRYSEKSYFLGIGDEHYGVEFEIYGLNGEVLNKYNPEIFEDRMWNLLDQIHDIVNKERISELNVMCLGDAVDGILRVSQLMKLRYGVVESSVKYAEFMSNWFNELTRFVNVNCQMTYGNHSELRMLGQPKGTFKDDNTGLFIREIIKERLSNNPNFNLSMNPTGHIFFNQYGFNVLGIHGEVKSMERAIKDFSGIYKTPVDYLVAGHVHHLKTESVGVNQEVINVPSIMGVDDFALSLNRTNDAGALLFILENGKGKVQEYNIKL